MDIETLKELLKEHETQNHNEKIDYVISLENIKIKLRAELSRLSNENFGQWFLNQKENTFFTSKNIDYIFDNHSLAQDYFQTFEEKSQQEIVQKLGQLEDRESLRFSRKLLIENKTYEVREEVTFIEKLGLHVGALKDMTAINKIRKNIFIIDKTIYNLMKVFDKNVILIQCDARGILRYVSSAFCDMSRFKDTEIIGHNIEEFEAKGTQKTLQEIFKETLNEEKTIKHELKFLKKNGNSFWVKAFVSSIPNEDLSTSYTLICHDITNQKLLEETINHDALTGIYNRRYYTEIINKEINRCKRDKKILSFAMIDIDYFKQYNDAYGHRNGDDVLKEVATCLNANLKRGEDYLFRMGGEEFCAIFSGYDDDKAFEFCQKLKRDVEELQIPHRGNKVSPYVTVSIGLVVTDLSHEVIDEVGLYTTSDNALYSAKAAGRNKIFVHPHGDLDLF